MQPVPTTREVVPGALVNIVLKADQPTGRTVQGTVTQLLTRGNHPRGIKVRLTDGRVGRVQSMAEGFVSGAVEVQPDEDIGFGSEVAMTGTGQGRGGRNRGPRRERRDQDAPPSSQPVGLDAYIRPAKHRGKPRNSEHAATGMQTDGFADHDAPRPSLEPEEATCPICGDFRGDVAAVNHHAQTHFDD
ncbi:hypothetical protein VTI74DRAFT_7829 [Chaetomium olivicolor]